MRRFKDTAVAEAFASCPPPLKTQLLTLRELIFQTAASSPGVGPLDEVMKWGEPAYLTSQSRSGSTIRIGWKKSAPTQYALHFNCKTNLIESFKTMFPRDFEFDGKRAIVFQTSAPVPCDALAFCIAKALVYHCSKSRSATRV